MNRMWMRWAGGVLLPLICAVSLAEVGEVVVQVRQINTEGEADIVGEVRLRDTSFGLLLVPDLKGLVPGPYAMHVHEHPDCGPAKMHGEQVPGGAAGGHFDPDKTGRHEGPYGQGHLGDLPVVIADKEGQVSIPVLAPRLEARDLRNRALMIHEGVDKYSDHAGHHHGMGGMRMYCGVIAFP